MTKKTRRGSRTELGGRRRELEIEDKKEKEQREDGSTRKAALRRKLIQTGASGTR
jgi:hypothetical protein